MNLSTEQQSSAFGNEQTSFFYDLTPEKILRSVETFGFECTGRVMQLNSMENRVYEVEIETGNQKLRSPAERFRIVKFYRPRRWTKEQILEEHQYLLDLAEYEIPAVAPLVLDNKETLFQLPEASIFCALFPKVGGRNPEELDSVQLPQVARLLARMHGVGATRKAEKRLRLTAETFGLTNLDYLLENGTLPPHLCNRYESAVRHIVDRSAPWFEDTEVQRIHGDCHLGNLLFGPDGFFWVDFDDMLRGPCVQDLWLLAGGRDEEAKNRLKILVDCYEQMREFDHNSLRLIEPLRALRVVHFNTWIAKRWSDPAFPRTFVEFGTERYWQEQVQFLEEQQELVC